ncbi:MAG: protein phosphatase 2C domain-containing protein [Blastocatellia bacterium]
MELKAGFVCDRGLNPKRPVNQDRYLALAERGLFAVFDGVGGQRAGEVASETAAETIEESLAHSSATSSAELIRRAIQFANRDIFEMAESDPAYKTMATTVALLHIDGDHATVAHVGDSRVYRLEEGRFFRETIDHTDYHDDLRAGQAAGSQAGRRNVINRALGVEAEVEVEIKTLHLCDGARFLLCSDGIYRHLSDEEMAHVLAQFKDPQQAANELKRLVHERGADDNLTAIVVQVGRAKQSVVLAIEDPLAAPRAAQGLKAQVAEAQRGGGRGNRIEVNFSKSPRPPAAFDERRLERRAVSDSPLPVERRSGSRWLLWSLVVLLLLGGAFYGGLRASEWKGLQTSEPPQPNDPMKMGRAAFDQANYPTAAAQFAAAVERDAQNPEAYYWLGRAQLESGEYPKAAASFENAATRRPMMFDAYTQAAQAYELAGDRLKAAQMLQRGAEERRKAPSPARAENANAPR